MGVPRIYQNVSTRTVMVYRGGQLSGNRTENQPYSHVINRGNSDEGTYIFPTHVVHDWVPSDRDFNRLHSKLKFAVEDSTSELLTAAAEWNSSLRMITARATQLSSAFRALRRWDLPLVGKELLMSPADIRQAERRSLKHSQRPTQAWLEYWMGWAPSISDIANAASVLSREWPTQHVSVSVKCPIGYVYDLAVGTQIDRRAHVTGMGRLATYADAVLVNRNLALANQLGLINPFLTGFQILPFSFIANWFVNLEQFIGQLNAFAGISLYNQGIARKHTQMIQGLGWRRRYDYDLGKYVIDYYSERASSEARFRTPGGLPPVKLRVTFNRLSLTRAATAVSLLSEIFLFKKK